MRILWITNTIFPAPSKAMGLKPPVHGGWMYGLAEQVASQSSIQLAVASCYFGKGLRKDEIEGITYFTLPFKDHNRYPKELEHFWISICEDFKPDIIHIHGTEYPRALACMRACSEKKYIVSIQGMISVISRYFYAGLSIKSILRNFTIRDIIKRDSILHSHLHWNRLIELEKEYYKKADCIIGRTNWDYVHAKAIFEKIKYYSCNESLRNEFYEAVKWDYNICNKKTIFVSQAGSSIKGLHNLIKALNLIIKEFPDIKVRIAGRNIVAYDSLKDKFKISGYGLYLRKLIIRNNMLNNFEFLGLLDANDMIKEFQNANLYICPSSIENSPNSLGEAQLIGTPVIASFVGGIPDMVIHNQTGLLYRFEEIEMLAHFIKLVITNSDFAIQLSKNEIIAAEKRHNKSENLKNLISIYKKLNMGIV